MQLHNKGTLLYWKLPEFHTNNQWVHINYQPIIMKILLWKSQKLRNSTVCTCILTTVAMNFVNAVYITTSGCTDHLLTWRESMETPKNLKSPVIDTLATAPLSAASTPLSGVLKGNKSPTDNPCTTCSVAIMATTANSSSFTPISSQLTLPHTVYTRLYNAHHTSKSVAL